jgi:hypothetical protein
MRVLLDQGFPSPPGFRPSDLDATIEYVSLVKFAPELSRVSTPDWMVILAAAKGGFDALAVDDQELRDNENCLVALSCTKVSLIAWTSGIDPVTGWAQLVAYMPKIRQKMNELGPSIFLLPSVRIVRESNVLTATNEVRKRAKSVGKSYPELRRAASGAMRTELAARKRLDLAGPLP